MSDEGKDTLQVPLTLRMIRGTMLLQDVFDIVAQEGGYDINVTANFGDIKYDGELLAATSKLIDTVGVRIGDLHVDCSWVPPNFDRQDFGRYEVAGNRAGAPLTIFGEVGGLHRHQEFSAIRETLITLIRGVWMMSLSGASDFEIAEYIRNTIDQINMHAISFPLDAGGFSKN